MNLDNLDIISTPLNIIKHIYNFNIFVVLKCFSVVLEHFWQDFQTPRKKCVGCCAPDLKRRLGAEFPGDRFFANTGSS